MKATAYIWKYRAANNYMFANYFLSPVFVDKIKVSDLPPDGIPIYNEQLEKSDETLEFTAGDLDVKLSLLGNSLSVQGDTLKDFMLPQGERNFFYICVVEFGDETDADSKRVGGRIDLSSIEANLTETMNRYDISFKVTGIIKELSVLQEKAQLTALQSSMTIDMFLMGCLKPDPTPFYLGAISRLHWEQRVGFEPVLMWEVYNDIISRNIGKGKWSVFKELAKGFGFMFKMSVLNRANLFDADYPPFVIETFWRSEGLNEVTIYRKSAIEKYSDLNSYKNYFVITYRSDILGNSGAYSGMLAANDGSVYIADGLIDPLLELVQFEDNSGAIITVVNGSNPPVVAEQASTVIHLPTYPTQFEFNTGGLTNNLIRSEMSLAALFCRNYHSFLPGGNWPKYVIIYGLVDVIKYTIGRECKYLIHGLKKGLTSEIVFGSESKINIYDVALFNENRYFCNSIKDIDTKHETSNSIWTEC